MNNLDTIASETKISKQEFYSSFEELQRQVSNGEILRSFAEREIRELYKKYAS